MSEPVFHVLLSSGAALITDFGVARALTEATTAALRTYVAIRAKADAAHQADLQDARATLARLEKETHRR